MSDVVHAIGAIALISIAVVEFKHFRKARNRRKRDKNAAASCPLEQADSNEDALRREEDRRKDELFERRCARWERIVHVTVALLLWLQPVSPALHHAPSGDNATVTTEHSV